MKKTKPDYQCVVPTCKLIKLPGTDYCIYHFGIYKNAKAGFVKQEDKYNPNEFKNESEMFKYIWETRPHVCCITGDKLDEYFDTDLFPNLFLHVLPKRANAYPEFRLYTNNVCLALPEVHTMFDTSNLEKLLLWEEKTGKSFEFLFDLERILHKEYTSNVKKRKLRDINQQYFEIKNL